MHKFAKFFRQKMSAKEEVGVNKICQTVFDRLSREPLYRFCYGYTSDLWLLAYYCLSNHSSISSWHSCLSDVVVDRKRWSGGRQHQKTKSQ